MLTTNDSASFQRAKLNEDLSAFCKCIGTDFGGDFVPAKFAILLADQSANILTDGFGRGVVHRGSLAEASPSMD
jgi:hypothetical protein